MYYTFLGHNVAMVECGEKCLLIDPWISGNPWISPTYELAKIDYILITHGHFDHLGDSVALAKKYPQVKLISNPEISRYLEKEGVLKEQLCAQYIGSYVAYEGFCVKGVMAAHGSSLPDGSYGGIAMGFIIESKGVKLYISGDTGLTMEMKLLQKEKINVACLPVGGRFTLGIDELEVAMDLIQATQYIPVHYNTFPMLTVPDEQLEKWSHHKNIFWIKPLERVEVK